MTSGATTNNQEAGATGRLELFQEADGVQARETLAERVAAATGGRVDRLARLGTRFAGVLERQDERSTCCARTAVRGVHMEKAGEFSAHAADSACQACHDGPVHHEIKWRPRFLLRKCHVEHRGRIALTTASNRSCAARHANLKVAGGPVHYAATIHSLEDGHPEFAALRDGAKDPGTIRLNHAIHMKPIRRGPNGPLVQLECGDRHRPATVSAPWPYEDRTYVFVQTSNSLEAKTPLPGDSLPAPKPLSGRESMTPPKFATGCAGCHLLTFDKRFDEGVPHDKPEIVHAFLVKKFQDYIAGHPAELQVARDPRRDLTGKPTPPDVRVLSRAQWVAERTRDAEVLLWRKTCKQCHELSGFVMIGDTVAAGWAGPTPESQIFAATWISVMSDGARNVLPPLRDDRACTRTRALVTTCKVRSRCPPRIFMHGLPCESIDATRRGRSMRSLGVSSAIRIMTGGSGRK